MLKVFKGNTTNCNTFISFIIEVKKTYDLKKVTIIVDKGISINRNIRFLNTNHIDFIIFYRLKTSSKEFKNLHLMRLNINKLTQVQDIKNMNITLTETVKELMKMFEEKSLRMTFLELKKIKKSVEI
ncbi:transposase [Mycoplasma phocimorsus]|uniref:transposase n=1 Tax=Mycoplasma phocimorsus TaxID=3045839 RepID=UPI0024BF54D5|nr:transposase [Mycoplasma phocimorsus]MDJ1648553.1 transposase [Mycoplasma phocimorsus]